MFKYYFFSAIAALVLIFTACENLERRRLPDNGPTHYEKLQGLDWLEGKWVDKEAGSLIEMEGKWDKYKNFLTQKFSVTLDGKLDLEGFQIIGWDPAKKQIRSWVFDSDGGFGTGVWKNEKGNWIVESEQTMPDGKKGTSINIYSNIQKDSYTWESTGREVGGKMMPNIEPVTVRRK